MGGNKRRRSDSSSSPKQKTKKKRSRTVKGQKGKGSASSSKSVGGLEDIKEENDKSDDESPRRGVCVHVQAGGCECRGACACAGTGQVAVNVEVCAHAQARGCTRVCTCAGTGLQVWGCVHMCRQGAVHGQ
eukprot:5000633-Pyramimonas_sp.AAC.1